MRTWDDRAENMSLDSSLNGTAEPLLILEPSRAEKHYWADLWRYRELFLILAWRDLAVRYKQTMIGLLWAVLRPLLTLAALTVIFHRIAKLPSDGEAPYPLMVFAALLPWSFFASTLTEASNSLIVNANLISKVYFPRLIVPTATLLTELVDMAIGFILLIGLMSFYQFAPSWNILLLPLFVVLAVLTSSGRVCCSHRSTSNIATSGMSFRSSSSSASTSRRSASAAGSSRKNGAFSTVSIRWSGSSMAFAGPSSAGTAAWTGPAFR